MATTVVEQLRLSVGALSAERRRLEGELMALERKASMTTNIDDNLVRKLRAQVDAEEAKLAEARAALAQAEAHTRVLARDRAAAQQAAHQEAVAACKARLGDLLDRKLAIVQRLEQLAREMLEARKELLAVNAEARAEAGRLDKSGLVPADRDVINRMSLRESKMVSMLPGCRVRFGHVELPANSFGLVPGGLGWAEDESRYHRDARALIEEVA
jgi:chromosome segregation ATPase